MMRLCVERPERLPHPVAQAASLPCRRLPVGVRDHDRGGRGRIWTRLRKRLERGVYAAGAHGWREPEVSPQLSGRFCDLKVALRPWGPRREVWLRSVLTLMACLSHACAASAAGWNQFRGPDGSGAAPDARPPVKLGAASLAWKTPVPPGLSSPVLSRDRVFLTAVDGPRLVTLAFDAATGREVWRRAAPEVPLEKVHEAGSPAASTPFVDDRRVIVYFGSFGLLCYDHDGGELWRQPMPTPRTLYGMATSPVAHGNTLFLVLDNDANLPDSRVSASRLLALDKTTGEKLWETPRPLQRSGWSTPALWRHADGGELVVFGSGRVCGYDPQTGAEKWSVSGFARETIVQPVTGAGHVYVSTAMGGVADEQPDPLPFWQAMLHFDANGDGRLERGEITEHFTFPFRPELPPGHPGFGMPLPSDPARRKERQLGIFAGGDKNQDGVWTQEEFAELMSASRRQPRLVAIRQGGRGDVTGTHVAWELKRSVPEIPTPLFHDGRLYLVRNGGLLTAVDAHSGEILFDERLGSSGQYSASPVVAGGHLYLVSNRGVVNVVKAAAAFEPVHQHDLGEAAFVTPAFDARTLYLRTGAHLWAFRDGTTAGTCP
jgi:outer membrane protein assembly factor BamB